MGMAVFMKTAEEAQREFSRMKKTSEVLTDSTAGLRGSGSPQLAAQFQLTKLGKLKREEGVSWRIL